MTKKANTVSKASPKKPRLPSKPSQATGKKKAVKKPCYRTKIQAEKFNFEECTVEQFKALFRRHPSIAREKMRQYIKPEQQERPELLEVFLDASIDAIIQYGSNQELLVLYVRWAKRAKNHFHSDSLSVVHCIRNSDVNAFPRVFDVLLKRNLTYYPRTPKRKGSIFGNQLQFSDYNLLSNEKTTRKPTGDTDPTLSDEQIEQPFNFHMSSIAARIESLQAIIENVAMGKVGYARQAGQPGQTVQNRQLSNDPDGDFYFTRNLIECHKAKSALHRIASEINMRHLAFLLCEMLFKFRQSQTIWKKSIELTELCRDKNEFLTVLAGVSLLFPDLSQMGGGKDNQVRDKWFNDTKGLYKKALAKARSQWLSVDDNSEILTTIRRLNQYDSKFSYHGISGDSDTVREQKFLLVRAAIFQKWLLSNRKPIKNLRIHVLSKLGTTKISEDDLIFARIRNRTNSSAAGTEMVANPTEEVDELVDNMAVDVPNRNFKRRLNSSNLTIDRTNECVLASITG